MQCIACIHQHRRFRAADGDIVFLACAHPVFRPDRAPNSPERELLERICLRDARRGDCLQYERMVMSEGQYLAEDLIPPVPNDCDEAEALDSGRRGAFSGASPLIDNTSSEAALVRTPAPALGRILAPALSQPRESAPTATRMHPLSGE